MHAGSWVARKDIDARGSMTQGAVIIINTICRNKLLFLLVHQPDELSISPILCKEN